MSERKVQLCDALNCKAETVEHDLYPIELFTITEKAQALLSRDGFDASHLCENHTREFIDDDEEMKVDYETKVISLIGEIDG